MRAYAVSTAPMAAWLPPGVRVGVRQDGDHSQSADFSPGYYRRDVSIDLIQPVYDQVRRAANCTFNYCKYHGANIVVINFDN